MSESMHAIATVRTCKQGSSVLDMRDDWPREAFFQVYDQLLAQSRFSSSEAVAEAADFSPSNLSRWRSGKAKPTPDLLRALANALGVEAFVLWEAAGILPPGAADKLRHATGPAARPVVDAFTTGRMSPPEMDRVINLYNKLSPDNQNRLRSQLEMLAEWAELAIARQKT